MALGRTKTGRRQQKSAQSAEPDHEFESYLAALAPEESVESTGSGRRFGASQVYQLRLPLMANERLRELAFKQGTSPAALARDWVMQHLADADEEPVHSGPAPSGQGPMWPGEDMQQGFGPAPEYDVPAGYDAPAGYDVPAGYAVPTGYDGIEQTDEITMPQKRFQR